MRGSITRRAWLERLTGAAMLAGTAAVRAQTDAAHPDAGHTDTDPLQQLRGPHPRLILPDSDLDKLRLAVRENALAKRIFADLEKECDRLLSVPPVEYKLAGPRLQTQTRRAVDRITTLALMYRLTGRDPWLRRTVMELNAVANFKDWNPARFVETAELIHAFAIGYDWLFNALSTEERGWVRDALILKGLDPGIAIYQQKNWWTREHFNWNIACNSAMAMGALAVADEAHDKAAAILRAAIESIPRGLASFGNDGGWAEGPAYGEYATRYATLFFASLETALGNDLGMNGQRTLDRAARFRTYLIGPANRIFNFGDGSDDPGEAPEMFWIAKRVNTPGYSWSEQRQLEHSMHPDAYDLAWFDREAKAPQPPAWPLDAVFHGTAVATFRGSWEDSNAIFLAVKGGDNKSTHAHFDLGSFVLDAGGVRWAADLGPDDPNVPLPQRGALYRVRTESHNTLLIDGESQDSKAEARIVHQELAQDFSWVQIDLSKASPKLRQWTRRIGLAQRQAALIGDSLRSDQPVDVLWSMMTDADISLSGPAATLHKNGWNLLVEIRTPRHAVFDVAPVHAPSAQAANPKFQKLIVRLAEKVTELDLNIVLTPCRDGQTRPKIAAQFPA